MDNRSITHTRWNCTYHIVFIPKYEDKRIFRIPLKTDPRIFTKVARNSKKWTGKVYCVKVATAKIIPITIDFFIYTPIL